jgi:hypothetical protein
VPHPRLKLAISIMEALAIFAYAISGFIEARKRRLVTVPPPNAVASATGSVPTASYSRLAIRPIFLRRLDQCVYSQLMRWSKLVVPLLAS